jgi:hypothetical protein
MNWVKLGLYTEKRMKEEKGGTFDEMDGKMMWNVRPSVCPSRQEGKKEEEDTLMNNTNCGFHTCSSSSSFFSFLKLQELVLGMAEGFKTGWRVSMKKEVGREIDGFVDDLLRLIRNERVEGKDKDWAKAVGTTILADSLVSRVQVLLQTCSHLKRNVLLGDLGRRRRRVNELSERHKERSRLAEQTVDAMRADFTKGLKEMEGLYFRSAQYVPRKGKE